MICAVHHRVSIFFYISLLPKLTGLRLISTAKYQKFSAEFPGLLSTGMSSRTGAELDFHEKKLDVTNDDNHLLCFEWIDLNVPPSELRPDLTLIMGQCFNWRRLQTTKTESSNCWVGMLGPHPIAVQQTPTTTLIAHLLHNGSKQDAAEKEAMRHMMREYFQLNYSLEELYKEWAGGCSRMKTVTECLQGVRVVRQDPWECLISFICSSNNNIKRITLMLDKLRYRYGHYVCSLVVDDKLTAQHETKSSDGIKRRNVWRVQVLDKPPALIHDTGSASAPAASPSSSPMKSLTPTKTVVKTATPKSTRGGNSKSGSSSSMKTEEIVLSPLPTNEEVGNDDALESSSTDTQTAIHLYSFPSISSLASASEEELRGMGMGYRAKFIRDSAAIIMNKPEGPLWLNSLREFGTLDLDASQASRDGQEKQHDIYEVAQDNRLKVQTALTELSGVGRKVADCVALFSLDQTQVCVCTR
jgi:3-methyladenine DNA glycosylase/8-oxoguanine DNA glycosylase